ncbi:MAG: S-layer homology domain-containing protein [Syntrophomonas sp.]
MAKHTARRILSGATLFIFVMGIILIGPGSYLLPVQADSRFSDIADDDLNKLFIDYIVAEGIMNGFPDGNFYPGEALTRAQAAVIMCNAFQRKINYDADSRFKDVPLSHWSATYIKAAAKSGYLNRLPDNIYNPEEALTRAEGVCMVLGLSKQSYTGVKLPQVSDMDESHWAAPAIALALDAGMIQTEKGDIVRPDSPMTRSELCRALAVLLISDPGLYETKLIGTLTVTNGEVWMGRIDKPARHTVTGILPVMAGDLIVTRDNSEAILDYPDGSRLLLKSNSCLKINESMGRSYIKWDGTSGTAVDKLELECPYGEILGTLSTLTYAKNPDGEQAQSSSGMANTPWYQTASQTKDKIKIQLPGGLFSIQGTVYLVKEQTVGVLEGSGSITTPIGSTGLKALQQYQLDTLEKVVSGKIMSGELSQQILQNPLFILTSIYLERDNRSADVTEIKLLQYTANVNQSLDFCLRTVLAGTAME